MPTFNSGRFILDAITSVVLQSHRNWELIIIDDGSTDQTHDLLEPLLRMDERITVLNVTENLGQAHARNLGMKAASGELLAFLDADDIWDPQKLNDQIRFMRRERVDFSYTSFFRINSDLSRISPPIKIPKIVTPDLIDQYNPIPLLTAMVRKDIVLGHSFDTRLFNAEDYQFWREIIHSGHPCHALDVPLAYYRVVNGSTSHRFYRCIPGVVEINMKYRPNLGSSIQGILSYLYLSSLKHLEYRYRNRMRPRIKPDLKNSLR